jgi:rhamnogalacturonyl hydrolase YesR
MRQALLDYYFRISPDKDVCLMFNSIIDYLMKYHLCNYNGNYWLKYYADSNDDQITFNASILGAVFLRKIAVIANRENEVADFCKQALDTVISYQKSDGRWNYHISLNTGFEKPQIDFHQGFILDALLDYMELTGFNEPYLSSYIKGLEYYYNKQFCPNGQSLYRVPNKWPADIQNQAQGIITFARAAKAIQDEKYSNFAMTIAEWTINNMQDESGHFYFLKYPFLTNKIRYVRWSDAPIAYALSVLLTCQPEIQKKSICLESRLHTM